MKKILINEIPHLVDERFEDFTFYKKPSSNVNVFGHSIAKVGFVQDFVIQFSSGHTYLYENIDSNLVIGAIECESIGKYYRAEISSKNTSIKMIRSAVVLESETPKF